MLSDSQTSILADLADTLAKAGLTGDALRTFVSRNASRAEIDALQAKCAAMAKERDEALTKCNDGIASVMQEINDANAKLRETV